MEQHGPTRIEELLQRIFFQRARLKMVLPSSVERFKAKALEDDPSGKTTQLFFLFGIMMARQDEPATMGEIARALDVPMSTATRIVDWFVQNDYVQRLSDPDDRRIVRIDWTVTGQELYKALFTHVLGQIERLLAHFSASEREQFMALLEKFTYILENEV